MYRSKLGVSTVELGDGLKRAGFVGWMRVACGGLGLGVNQPQCRTKSGFVAKVHRCIGGGRIVVEVSGCAADGCIVAEVDGCTGGGCVVVGLDGFSGGGGIVAGVGGCTEDKGTSVLL